MKTKTVFVMLLVLLTCSCFAQEGDKTTKLNNYLNMLEKYKKYNFEEFNNLINKLDNKALWSEAKIIYEAIEVTPMDVERIIKEDIKRVDNIYKKNKLLKVLIKNIVSNQNIQGIILNKIEEKYGREVFSVINNPIILKAKVLSLYIIRDDLMPGMGNRFNNKKVLTLSTEEVIKGKVDFVNQPKIEVYYRDWQEVYKEDFKVGGSYLFFLHVEKLDDKYPFAVNVLVDRGGSRFLIDNSSIAKDLQNINKKNNIEWNSKKQSLIEIIDRINNKNEYNYGD